MKYLFIPGYTVASIAHHGVPEEGVQFIRQPCSRKELAPKIRIVLEGEN